ncbi:RNA 2',3'-cyclic phosphodiesterase [Cellulomonas dongxiuzhuiae]|uniref:RNA 2',3'-cyclic phosphodiesterase n=1 Tax=Cellulomonas dongxiuzhuiae TaxID=2819979 RepID=A0ABX8GMX6_9CELL|nr:RNA 2',3'-cyclic phosphodiesterase [Cellulomonas dongxiuzhuiae]MBO3096226.1 RNA 2',3'-cyclic phosphodiesterase [Cellulomonas dongxiuzhuiae]QWC17484.1 RNA 2',3'-cyclic phosphodiesterase [Cellulomonas dongxiuzhuiae]
MRLFAAVWPPDDVLDHLDLALAVVRRGSPSQDDGVRWSARETWHLTAAFYGTLPDAVTDALGADLAQVAAEAEPFDLQLRGAGVFAHRTLWVGTGGDVATMAGLATAARAVGEAHGAPSDPRVRHRPHLTVGRARPGARPPRRGSRATASGGRAGGPGPGRTPGGDPRELDPAEVFEQALAVYEGPTWRVDALALVASRPGEGRGGGPLYATVATFALGR